MARVKERHAYVDPKDIEEINMTGTPGYAYKKWNGNLYGQVRDPVFCRFESFLEIM